MGLQRVEPDLATKQQQQQHPDDILILNNENFILLFKIIMNKL